MRENCGKRLAQQEIVQDISLLTCIIESYVIAGSVSVPGAVAPSLY